MLRVNLQARKVLNHPNEMRITVNMELFSPDSLNMKETRSRQQLSHGGGQNAIEHQLP